MLPFEWLQAHISTKRSAIIGDTFLIKVKPGYSINQPPAHWGTPDLPESWHNALLTWSWGDFYLKSSQCGQAELISYLLRKTNIPRAFGYFDIGANDGITRSSTALLSALGYRGVLVEPNPLLASQLRYERSCDIIFNCACANEFCITALSTSPDISGLGTLSSLADLRAIARLNEEATRLGTKVVRFPCIVVPASRLFKYALDNLGPISFLKVDAEGCEQTILTDIMREVQLDDLPAFIEVENNYRDQVCYDILKHFFSLVCVMDSFVEIYARKDLASLSRASTLEFFKRLSCLDN